MTNEEFLQRYDSGKPNFTISEITRMAYGHFGNFVDRIEGDIHRWFQEYQEVETVFEVNGRLFAISWDRKLTDMLMLEDEEDEFDNDNIYEVEKKEKVIIDYVRKEVQ